MIIKGSRVLGRSVSQFLVRHLLHGDENDVVVVLAGGEDHLRLCIEAARNRGCRYAVRHFVISPEQSITDEQAWWVVERLAREFNFRIENVTMVRHEKERAHIGAVPHYHLVVPEFDPENSDRILSSKWSYARHEKVARQAEVRFGHTVTPGPHNDSVITFLEAAGDYETLRALRNTVPPREATEPATSISPVTSGRMKAVGLDVTATHEAVRSAYEVAASGAEFLIKLQAMGLRVAQGERRRTLAIFRNEDFVGAVHRILGRPVAEVRTFLTQAPPKMMATDEVTAEIERQKAAVAKAPEPDSRRLVSLREKLAAAQNVRQQRAKKIQENELHVAALEKELAEHRRWWNRLFRREQAATCSAAMAQVTRLIADERRFLREFTVDGLKNEIKRASNVLAFERDKLARETRLERERLQELAVAIEDGDMRFESLAELRDFLNRYRVDEERGICRRESRTSPSDPNKPAP